MTKSESALHSLKSVGNLKLLVKPGEKPSLVAGIVLGPAIWLVALQAKFSLVPFACWNGWTAALHTVTLISIVLILAILYVCLRNWKLAGAGSPGESGSPADRDRFLALLGMGSAVFSLLAVVTQEIGNFFLGPCQ
jgi:hypothetical protein